MLYNLRSPPHPQATPQVATLYSNLQPQLYPAATIETLYSETPLQILADWSREEMIMVDGTCAGLGISVSLLTELTKPV
jgi:hypothetical protein